VNFLVLNSANGVMCLACHDPNRVMTGQTNPLTNWTTSAHAMAANVVTNAPPAAPLGSYHAVAQNACISCHAPHNGVGPTQLLRGANEQDDPLNIIPQLALTASSSHPVTHDSSSPLSQPSLLSNMLNIDGVTQGRAMGVRILCTDCHNSDDNREFGGTGPNGPHGSKFTHILERRYEFSQAAQPGQPVMNLFPNPDLSVAGPYALCGKCHNLTTILANTSFSQHSLHINAGFSCSACHTAHGMGSLSATVSGERLVNFDANVVAPNGATPISYSRAKNSCNLVCHGQVHGGATFAGAASHARPGKAVHR
jgi:hypothetical protein